jgi:hypothetical protein
MLLQQLQELAAFTIAATPAATSPSGFKQQLTNIC